jgi:type IV pilus assembly protein PilN
MRNLEASPVMERPDLVEIKAATVGNRRLSEFNLNVSITRQTTEDDKNAKKVPAAKDAKP